MHRERTDDPHDWDIPNPNIRLPNGMINCDLETGRWISAITWNSDGRYDMALFDDNRNVIYGTVHLPDGTTIKSEAEYEKYRRQ